MIKPKIFALSRGTHTYGWRPINLLKRSRSNTFIDMFLVFKLIIVLDHGIVHKFHKEIIKELSTDIVMDYSKVAGPLVTPILRTSLAQKEMKQPIEAKDGFWLCIDTNAAPFLLTNRWGFALHLYCRKSIH
jgi:hypothetical protein